MDKSLYPFFITQVVLNCYPCGQKETVRDETRQKIEGLLVIKCDAGPGAYVRTSLKLNSVRTKQKKVLICIS